MMFTGLLMALCLFPAGSPVEEASMLLLSPMPKRFVSEATFSLPDAYHLSFEGSGLEMEDPGISMLRGALAARGGHEDGADPFRITAALIEESGICRDALEAIAHREALPDHEEAYFVHLAADGAVVGGRSPRAVYYGLLTLSQWIDASPPSALQGGWILDWPSLDHRGLMLDLARMMEKKPYYEKVLKFLSSHKFNVLVLHLTDDPAVTLRFERHPGPADPNAWTVPEMREFVRLAGRYHIELMPEIELFGHANGFLRHPDYRRLAEPGVPTLTPHDPGTYRLIRDLVEEAAGIFPFDLIHAGLDEVSGPTSKEGKQFVEKHGKGRWLADHIRKVHEAIAGQGKRMVMWGDMLLWHPEAAFALPRDVVIYDWHYEPDFDRRDRAWRTLMPPETWSRFMEMGFDVVAAPALMCGSWRLWPDAGRLENVLKSARLAAERGLMGVAVTIWVPPRYLPDAVWHAYALSGDAAWSGTGFDEQAARAAFFHHYFGLAFDGEDSEHLDFLLRFTPMHQDLLTLLWFREDWTARFLKDGGYRIKDCLDRAAAALVHFEERAASVDEHREEYEDLLRVARIIHHLAWREQNGRAILTDPEADALREECRRRTEAMIEEIRASWSRHRHGDETRIYLRSDLERERPPSWDLLQDFENAIAALERLDVKAGAKEADLQSLLERRLIGQDRVLDQLGAYTERRVAVMPEIKNLDEWEAYAENLRRAILEEIVFRGEARAWRSREGRVEWLDAIEGGRGYRIRKLRFEAAPGMWIPALLYEPDRLEGKVPAVMNVNGHDGNGKAADYKQVRCINLAKRGLLALNVDWIGMGQLAVRDFNHGYMNQLDLCGASGLAPFYLALERGLDALLSHEHADPGRVAVAGLSGGGWQTIVIGAMDPRVKLANPVAGYDSYRTRARHLNDLGDSEQTPVDLAAIADYIHLTALRAPRPTLLTYNDQDIYFATPRALPPLLAGAQPVFELHEKGRHLRWHANRVPGDHNFLRDNREALYRMLRDFGYFPDPDAGVSEIPCEDEVKTKEQLEVPLPANNQGFHSLALSLLDSLPRNPGIPEEAAALEAWYAARRGELKALLRAREYQVKAERIGEESSGDVRAVFWLLHMDDAWTLPAVELVRGDPGDEGFALVIADGGRRRAGAEIGNQLSRGRRVLALDPLHIGEMNTGYWNWLYALLISSVGDRPLGLQASQAAAAARWLAEERRAGPVSLVSTGPRAGLCALAAAGLEEDAVANVELHGALKSLKEIIEKDWSFREAPELFCFGLLEAFDCAQLGALVAPRPVKYLDQE